MAGSFVGTNAAPAKSKHGRGHPGKESARQVPKPDHPITDSFASKVVPNYATRRKATNNKSGFNTVPSQPPAGRLAQRSDWHKDRCASGRVVGRDEHHEAANSRGSKGTRGLKVG